MADTVEIIESFVDQERLASERIKRAAESKATLFITGGQTRGFLGRATLADDTISSHPFSGVLSYEPSELVLRVGAGTKVCDIQAMLAEKQQCLAFEPHSLGDGRSTIGGAVATAMAGAGRPWQGGVKDHVLGLGLINGEGDILKFGGQVMKNVAGYDVSRAMVGSLGCMGLITELSLKVLPIPASECHVQLPCSLRDAMKLAAQLDQGMTMRNGFAWYNGLAHLRFAGSAEAIADVLHQFNLSELVVDRDALWELLTTMTHPVFLEDEGLKLWRVVCPKYTDLSEIFADDALLMNWAGGEYFVRAKEADMRQNAAIFGRLGAHCYSLSGDNIYVLGGLSPTIERLHVSLKKAFDPQQVLNAGRMSEAF